MKGKRKWIFAIVVGVFLTVPGFHASVSANPWDGAGAVYTMSNDPTGNEVIAFPRSADGTLGPGVSYATGGDGTGAGLGNQGGVALSENNRWLFVVNAGSDSISVFRVRPDGLYLVGEFDSGGVQPISLTVDRDLLYVLNAGGNAGDVDSITGFTVGRDGTLDPIAGSTRPLSSDVTAPAQIEFSSDGNVLVVTEKGTNSIDTYVVGVDGIATGPTVFPSEGSTPFGFTISRQNQLFVSEAAGGVADASSLSSYLLLDDGNLQVISSAVPTTETAACWAVVTGNGRYVYTTNAGSGTISGYSVDHEGRISLLDPDGRTGVPGPGTVPLDMAFSENDRYLYSLNSGDGTISAFRVNSRGMLFPVDLMAAQGLPAGVNGLAAW